MCFDTEYLWRSMWSDSNYKPCQKSWTSFGIPSSVPPWCLWNLSLVSVKERRYVDWSVLILTPNKKEHKTKVFLPKIIVSKTYVTCYLLSKSLRIRDCNRKSPSFFCRILPFILLFFTPVEGLMNFERWFETKFPRPVSVLWTPWSSWNAHKYLNTDPHYKENKPWPGWENTSSYFIVYIAGSMWQDLINIDRINLKFIFKFVLWKSDLVTKQRAVTIELHYFLKKNLLVLDHLLKHELCFISRNTDSTLFLLFFLTVLIRLCIVRWTLLMEITKECYYSTWFSISLMFLAMAVSSCSQFTRRA